jgi:polyhydroxyalkanoate synthesis regulator phasin
MKHIKKWIAAAGVGLVLMTATVAALPAAASDTAVVQVQRGGIGQSNEYLAQALGVSADELEAAKQTAYQAALDQALAQGLLTQEQADAIAERAATSGRLSSRYLRGFTSGDAAIDVNALLAEALGITTDELTAARSEAQDLALAAAVEEGRITQEQADQLKARQALQTFLGEQGFDAELQALYQRFVQQAVQAGVITQEQADTLLSQQGSFHGMRGFGGMRGRAGHLHGMPGTQTPDAVDPSGAGMPGGFSTGGFDY